MESLEQDAERETELPPLSASSTVAEAASGNASVEEEYSPGGPTPLNPFDDHHRDHDPLLAQPADGHPQQSTEKTEIVVSRYDYDINWDMVGHSGQMEDSSAIDGIDHGEESLPAHFAVQAVDEEPEVQQLLPSPSPPISGDSTTSSNNDMDHETGNQSTSVSSRSRPNSRAGGSIFPSPEEQEEGFMEEAHFLPRRRSLSNPAPRLYHGSSSTREHMFETEPPEPLHHTLQQDSLDIPHFASPREESDIEEGFDNFTCTPVIAASTTGGWDSASEHGSVSSHQPSIASSSHRPTASSSSSGSRRRRNQLFQQQQQQQRQGSLSSSATGGGSSGNRSQIRSRTIPRPHNVGSNVVGGTNTISSFSETVGSSTVGTNSTTMSGNSRSGLRVSLDAGMAALRRWVRSRTEATASAAGTTARVVTTGGRPGGASRAATQSLRHFHDGAAGELEIVSGLGDQDLFASSYAGESIRHRRRRTTSDSSIVAGASDDIHSFIISAYPPRIEEEEDHHTHPPPRQRALSAPDAVRVRNFFFGRRARPRQDNTVEMDTQWTPRRRSNRRFNVRRATNLDDESSIGSASSCDLPLKLYFWLATFQLVLDIFRSDIMRWVLHWDSSIATRTMPPRVIVYNITYVSCDHLCITRLNIIFGLPYCHRQGVRCATANSSHLRHLVGNRDVQAIYACMVLRMGVRAVFFSDDETCSVTAPELYQATTAFITLSLAAWSTIILGYLVPFCFVAILLTRNGYSPGAENGGGGGSGNVFPIAPIAYGSSGAPPETIDQLRVVLLDEFPEAYPKECCICMGDFIAGEVIVATACQHVFHKRCCQEWLRQARTCPVCRMDIPDSLGISSDESNADGDTREENDNRRGRRGRPAPFGRQDFHHEVVNMLRFLRSHEQRLRDRNVRSAQTDEETGSASTQTTVGATGGSAGDNGGTTLEQPRTNNNLASSALNAVEEDLSGTSNRAEI
eukprot:scaffold69049_cov61-Attheya_sp.AAC.3